MGDDLYRPQSPQAQSCDRLMKGRCCCSSAVSGILRPKRRYSDGLLAKCTVQYLAQCHRLSRTLSHCVKPPTQPRRATAQDISKSEPPLHSHAPLRCFRRGLSCSLKSACSAAVNASLSLWWEPFGALVVPALPHWSPFRDRCGFCFGSIESVIPVSPVGTGFEQFLPSPAGWSPGPW